MSNQKELKRCPFCGCIVELRSLCRTKIRVIYAVDGRHDATCMLKDSLIKFDRLSYEEAADAWNMRASEVQEGLQIMMSAQPEHRWIPGREISRDYIGDVLLSIQYENWRCSNCNCISEDYRKPSWNYCPNCGVKMDL